MASYFLPKGTKVSICKVSDSRRRWKPYTTTKDLTFYWEYRTEEVRGNSGAVVFKDGDWFLLTRRDLVKRGYRERI